MMRLLRRLQVPVLLFCLCTFLIPTTSFAIPAKVKFANIEDIREIFVNDKKYYCGIVDGKTYAFESKLNRKDQVKVLAKKLKKKIKKLKQKIAAGNGNPKKLKKKKKRLAQLKKATSKACGIGKNLLKEFNGNVSEEKVRYLLEKAGLGASPAEMARYNALRGQGIAAVVNSFMTYRSEAAGFQDTYEDWLDGDDTNGINLDDISFEGIRKAWLYAMTYGNNPFYERLAKFLFRVVTTAEDVLDADEAHILNEYINGSATMDGLRKLARNPDMKEVLLDTQASAMMLIYLDGTNNIQSSPNENHAREILELFSTGTHDLAGDPNYTEEDDIPNLALAMTGYRVDDDGNAGYSPFDQYTGTVTLFPGTGYDCSVSGGGLSKIERVVDCIFNSHPNVANHYAKRLLEEYLTPTPSPELIRALAKVIRDNNFNLRPALATLFKSAIFYDAVTQDTIPKEASQYVVEVVRTTGIPLDVDDIEEWSDTMGQKLTAAPTVFWWELATWTSSPVALQSINFLSEVLRDSYDEDGWIPSDLLPSANPTALEAVRHVAAQLGVPLTSNMETQLVQYLNTRLSGDERIDDPWDPTSESQLRDKYLGLYEILFASIPGRMA